MMLPEIEEWLKTLDPYSRRKEKAFAKSVDKLVNGWGWNGYEILVGAISPYEAPHPAIAGFNHVEHFEDIVAEMIIACSQECNCEPEELVEKVSPKNQIAEKY